MPRGMDGEAVAPSSIRPGNMAYERSYCLFCKTGQEAQVAASIEYSENVRALFPQRVKTERRGNRWVHVNKPLIPGYVFLYAPDAVRFDKIYRMADVYRVLQYTDGERSLQGADRAFADWMLKYNGVIEVSRAMRVGGRVEIVDGPLIGLKSTIRSIDAHKRLAEVEMDIVGRPKKLWLSFDYLEQA